MALDSEATLKVGVVGAGVFAGYHANKIAAHGRAELTGIFDSDTKKASAASAKHEVPEFKTLTGLCKASEAVIIAIPASYHAEAAKTAIEAGCHLLIEKPLAATVADAKAIVSSVRKAGVILQVGHQERVVAEAIGLLDVPERPVFIETRRMMGRSDRNLDVSVVMDLMIHDIDLVQMLMNAEPERCVSETRVTYSGQIDEASADLRFSAGQGSRTARLVASRDAEPERVMTIRYPSGTVTIDFLSKTIRNETPFALDQNFTDKPEVKDSLATAFDKFVRSCLKGTPVMVSGEEALAAVKTAKRIEGEAP